MKRQNVLRAGVLVGILAHMFWCSPGAAQEEIAQHHYDSDSWKDSMNKREIKEEKYPNKRKITPETVRLAINEYYIPQISDLLDKGVDYYEWLNQLDDPYLNRYKVDLQVDPTDERLNLFWKRKF